MYRFAYHSAVFAMLIDDEGVDDDSSTAQLVKEVVCTARPMTPLEESSPIITSMSEEFVSFSPTIIVINEN
jgi:hypothetical protein